MYPGSWGKALRNRKPCYTVIETRVEVWENEECILPANIVCKILRRGNIVNIILLNFRGKTKGEWFFKE